MKIKDIILHQIFDSRAEETLKVGIKEKSGRVFYSELPSGKSRGANEAVVLGFEDAHDVLNKIIKKELLGKNYKTIQVLDKTLLKLDSTENKERLGGNLMLGISIAFARALAFEEKKEVWQYLGDEFFNNKTFQNTAFIFSNLINGGAHANNNLSIQEYLVIVKTENSLFSSIQKLILLYKTLEEVLKEKKQVKNLALGDEGGYSLDFENNFEPIKILEELICELNLEKEFLLGLDVAAGNFYKNGKYQFGEQGLSTDELSEVYKDYFARTKLLLSIEDPFAENDYNGFRNLKSVLGEKIIVGDDITTTNPGVIEKCANDNLINAVIIKPNQIGTVSESCEAIKTAHKNNLKCIISHRSGETADNFIVHLAKASGAYGVKIGAPIRERILKFNELLTIYDR